MPDRPIYRVGPQPGGPRYVPESPNNTEGPQAREPSKCLSGRSYWESLAEEAFWSPATRGSGKDSDRAITPAAEAVHVPAHLVPPGSPHLKQPHHLHVQPSLGQSCRRQKKKKKVLHLCVELSVVLLCILANQSHRVTGRVQLFVILWTVACQGLLCQGASSGKNTRAYWPILVTTPF